MIDDDSVAVFSATDLAAEESFALDSPLLQVVADSNGFSVGCSTKLVA